MSETDIRHDIAAEGDGSMSFVAACQHFFTKEPYGKKLAIQEFKALTQDDKIELRRLLIGEGYNVRQLTAPGVTTG